MKASFSLPLPAFAACLALVVAAPGQSPAATLTVTSTADSGGGSLRTAIKNARSGDTIAFRLPAPSTITLTGGELVIGKSLYLVGPGAENLTVSGRGASRVFRITTHAAVTLSGLTIADGLAKPTSTRPGAGGGIYNDHSTLTVIRCVLTRNTANELYGRGGGAIFNDGYGTSGSASLTVVDSTLNGNSAANSSSGGAIFNTASSGNATLTVTNCLFSGNTATREAGGLTNDGAGASATIVGCTFSDNASVAPNGNGGAIANTLGTMTLRNSTLNSNSAYRGGGIHLFAGSLTVSNCTLSANSATDGGGIANYNGSLTLLNSTLSGNLALMRGAGITNFISTSGRILTIGSTILDNSDPWGNLITPGSPAVSLGYNLCVDSGSGVLSDPTDLVNTAARLGPLAGNGGPTLTHAPLVDSPAIDRGKNLSAADSDQRGAARTVDYLGVPNAPNGDGTDIGAVEVQ